MRIALSIIVSLLLSLNLPALPNVTIGAAPGWLSPLHPDLRKIPATDYINDGFYYDLFELQSSLLQNTEYTHYIRNIVNGSGVQNGSEVSITFSPQFQHVVFHRIAILRNGATLDRLELQNIKVAEEETNADEFQYNGLKRAFITLKDVRKGDRIEVAYSVIGFNPVFNGKYSAEFSFTSSTAVCNYYRTLVTPDNRPLHIETVNNALAPTQRHQGHSLIYSWDNPALRPENSESAAPSWYNGAPTVYITEYAGWQDVIAWGLRTFNNYRYPLPAALREKIAAWRALAKTDNDRFTLLALRFVQDEVRYLGLEIGANTHRPHPPADVFAQRFGDCKDKALLLATILQQENIPAYAALISTDTRSRLPTVAPSPEAFDHVIVAIRNPAGAYTFVDPTITGQRGDLTELFLPDYGYALVLREGETGLQPVSPGRINDYLITETLDARYYDTSHFSIVSTYSGGAADDIRNLFAGTSRKELEENYRKYYGSLFDDLHQENHLTYQEDTSRNTVTVSKHYAIPQLWNTRKTGKRYFDFTARILERNLPDPSDVPDSIPLALTYPFNVHYTLQLAMPEDWDFSSGELHVRNGAYQFDFVPELHGSHMTLHYALKTFTDHIAAADLHRYKADYKNMADRISFQLYNYNTPGGSLPDMPAAETPAVRDWKVCWPAVWLTFFFSLFFSRLFAYLNGRSAETLYAPGTGYPLGGWLLLLGFSIGAILLGESIGLLRSNPYSDAHWLAFGSAGGRPLQYLVLSQLAIRLTAIAGAAALIYWFLRRRDIFPLMFLWYAGILFFGHLLLLGISFSQPNPSSFPELRPELTLGFISTALYSCIWSLYILFSGQVKSTFLEPFRERIR